MNVIHGHMQWIAERIDPIAQHVNAASERGISSTRLSHSPKSPLSQAGFWK
jgi:hypothetical protein